MDTPNDAVLSALKQALDQDPRNGPLWLHYADLLAQSGRAPDAVAALRTARENVDDRWAVGKRLVPLLRSVGELGEALARAEMLLEVRDDPELRVEYARALAAQGQTDAAAEHYWRALEADPGRIDPELEQLTGALAQRPPSAAQPPAPLGLDDWRPPAAAPSEESGELAEVSPDSDFGDWAARLDWGDLYLRFEDVAGLADVKRQINLRIIAPFKNPEIYQAFRRSAGGGILLYGPPGCGKTFVARATAGECGARFISVGIHEIVDRYWGESEKMMHALFEEARRRSPTVLFFDEFDALGSSRGRSDSQFWTTLVDQLLQEMDGLTGRNDELLVFAATNMPWNVDSAFRRPGRFDRILFVPPPDQAAREAILQRHAAKLPGGDRIDVAKLAKQTALFTGADLTALCQRAAEDALGRSLDSGQVHPVQMADFERELTQMQSSAQEWIATARNYARYSNESGQYDDLVEFLKRIKRW